MRLPKLCLSTELISPATYGVGWTPEAPPFWAPADPTGGHFAARSPAPVQTGRERPS